MAQGLASKWRSSCLSLQSARIMGMYHNGQLKSKLLFLSFSLLEWVSCHVAQVDYTLAVVLPSSQVQVSSASSHFVMGFSFLVCLRQGLVYPELSSNSLCSWGWFWTSDLPSPEITHLQIYTHAWATMLGLCFIEPTYTWLHGIEPRTSYVIGKHITNRATSLFFSYTYQLVVYYI